MKFVCFIVSFVTASAVLPWVFFARVNDTLQPLVGVYLGEQFYNMSMFAYGIPNIKAVTFSSQDDYAVALEGSEWQYAGFSKERFVFGPKVPFSPLKLDENRKVKAQSLYSCDLMNGPARGVMYGAGAEQAKTCFKVEIYFLQYDKELEVALIPPSPSGLYGITRKLCTVRFDGSIARRNLASFWKSHNGECDVIIDGALVRKV